MCFSAGASFGAGAVLLVIGTLSLKKVQDPSQLLFAAIPLLFSIQQFSEGFVWLSLTSRAYVFWYPYASYLFLFFAQVLWPAWVPLSIAIMEKDPRRKRILLMLSFMGSLMACFLAYCMLVYNVKAEIVSYHIHYILDFPLSYTWISAIFYFVPTVLPSFISGNKRMPVLGLMVLASYLFTKIFYPDYFISVWCFFAAIISAVILYVMSGVNRKAHQPLMRPV